MPQGHLESLQVARAVRTQRRVDLMVSVGRGRLVGFGLFGLLSSCCRRLPDRRPTPGEAFATDVVGGGRT